MARDWARKKIKVFTDQPVRDIAEGLRRDASDPTDFLPVTPREGSDRAARDNLLDSDSQEPYRQANDYHREEDTGKPIFSNPSQHTIPGKQDCGQICARLAVAIAQEGRDIQVFRVERAWLEIPHRWPVDRN